MSGFDDNSPFGDPFKDPSIAQVTTTTTTSNLDDYNPFANNSNQRTATVRGASNPPASAGPAVLETATTNGSRSAGQPVSSSTTVTMAATTAQTLTHEDLLRKQEELDRKAAELAAREEAIRNGTINIREPNWPPVPSFCPFGPCFYQDISVEIPVEFQRVVRLGFYLWLYFVGVLLANLLGGIAKWAKDDEPGYFSFSVVSLLLMTPLSYVCWFRPLYKAFRSDSSVNFMVFFFVFFCQLVMVVIWAIGIPGTGACGLIIAIESISNGNLFFALLMFAVCGVIISYAALSFLLLLKVHSIYKSTGASMDKARAEFANQVMSNQHVQQAAAGAARQAMSNAFNQGSRPNTGVRY